MEENKNEKLMHISQEDTLRHATKVLQYATTLVNELLSSATIHDDSKLHTPELETFAIYGPKLKHLTYNSAEYKANLAAMNKALDHHYKNNRHHPEHFEDGIKGMTLVDVIEMFCDWCAAAERHANGDIYESIITNKKRFNMSEDLTQILLNTVPLTYK